MGSQPPTLGGLGVFWDSPMSQYIKLIFPR
jgi:hypothetical protein